MRLTRIVVLAAAAVIAACGGAPPRRSPAPHPSPTPCPNRGGTLRPGLFTNPDWAQAQGGPKGVPCEGNPALLASDPRWRHGATELSSLRLGAEPGRERKRRRDDRDEHRHRQTVLFVV